MKKEIKLNLIWFVVSLPSSSLKIEWKDQSKWNDLKKIWENPLKMQKMYPASQYDQNAIYGHLMNSYCLLTKYLSRKMINSIKQNLYIHQTFLTFAGKKSMQTLFNVTMVKLNSDAAIFP